VETGEGIVGIGETYAGVYVPDLVSGIVAYYRQVLVGREITNPSVLYRDCYWVTSYCGRTGLTVMVLSGV
jgi:L-alanine-DL-glutamate epimerase-like enolase superfamily enzyme